MKKYKIDYKYIFIFMLILHFVLKTNAFSNEAQVNLKPYKPSSWDDIVVIANTEETNTNSVVFVGEESYIDYAYINNGSDDIEKRIYAELRINDEIVRSAYHDGLKSNYYVSKKDFKYIFQSAGKYTITFICDSKYQVTETNETDNIYTKTVEIFEPNVPKNDNFEDAQQIFGKIGKIQLTNSKATKEDGELRHADQHGGRSVWFKWVAPETNTVLMNTHNSTFDTLLAVYTGTTINTIKEIESNDDDGSDNSNSGLRFEATAGTTYYIVVDGYNEDCFGSFSLNWSQLATIFYDNFEGDISKWQTSSTHNAVNTWTVGGNGTAKQGNKSAYISHNNGVSAEYDKDKPGQAILSLPVDFSVYIDPVLTFWWKSLGEYEDGVFLPQDYGILYVNDGSDHLESEYYEYAKNPEWKFASIDLKSYQGKKVEIKFLWFNGYEKGKDPAFCIDDVKISATLNPDPIVIKPPKITATIEEAYSSTIQLISYGNQPVTIVSTQLPEWLSLKKVNPQASNAILYGIPRSKHKGPNNLTLHMTNEMSTIDKNFTIYVQQIRKVINTNDSGTGSLRQCIKDANPYDIIEFDVSGKIILESNLLYIDKPVYISGPGISNLSISGNNQFKVFQINGSFPISISNLTLMDGYSERDGSGIANYRSELSLDNIIILNNKAKEGAGLYNQYGKVTLKKSIIQNNQANSNGGGIYNELGDIIIDQCIIENNSSESNGGICNKHANLIITNSTIYNNNAIDSVGAIYNFFGTTKIINSTISENKAAYYAGIFNDNGIINICSSTIIQNTATQTDEYTGAAGALTNSRTGISFIKNSIFAQHTGNNLLPDISNNIESLGHNLIGNMLHNTFKSNTNGDQYGDPLNLSVAHPDAIQNTSQINTSISPYIQEIAPFIKTYLLNDSSPVIDSGMCNDIDGNSVLIDQRRKKRPSDGNKDGISKCDIGSIEWAEEEFNNILFISDLTDSLVKVGDKYSYTLTVYDSKNQLSDIKIISNHEWLKLKNIDLIKGTALIEGIPEIEDIGIHSLIIKAVNDNQTIVSQSCMLTVPVFFDDFENEQSNRTITGEVPYTHNFWIIGEENSLTHNKCAYISNDHETKEQSYNIKEKSISFLKYHVDLTHIDFPQLKFMWKCQPSFYSFDDHYRFGEVYIEDIDGTLLRASDYRELVDDDIWKIKNIDLNDYRGKKIVIIFKWFNDELDYNYALYEGLYIDDVEITGVYSKKPLIEKPMFTSNPELVSNLLVKTTEYFDYTITTFDVNNDVVNISCKNCPQWLQLDSIKNGVSKISGKPATDGLYDITIIASDAQYTSTQSFTINAHAVETYKFNRMWPVLQRPWYFYNLEGMSIDSKDNLYIADSLNHRILKYNTDGQLLKAWGSKGNKDGEFFNPYDLAIGPDDRVYVIDSGNFRVQVFDSDGNFINKWGGENQYIEGCFRFAITIAVDQKGYVYVGDHNACKILKFTYDGEYITSWGELGFSDGSFMNLLNIAVDQEGNVYVSGGYKDVVVDHFIQKFNSDGDFILKFGGFGSDLGKFNVPQGIFVKDNFLYVADKYNGRIQKFNLDGTCLNSWSTKVPGTIDEWIGSGPIGIAVDSNGRIYITDRCQTEFAVERVKIFYPGGKHKGAWKSFGNRDGFFFHPVGMDVDSKGTIYVCDQQNFRIQNYSQEKGKWKSWGYDKRGDDDHPIVPYDIAIKETEKEYSIYITDSASDRVMKFDKNGFFIKSLLADSSIGISLNFPTGIAIDNQENVYISDSSNHRIIKYNERLDTFFAWGVEGKGESEFLFPNEIAIDRNSNWIYVTDSLNNCVQKFTLNGEFLLKFDSKDKWDKKLSYPFGISVDKEGYVFVVDRNNNSIIKFNPQGQFIYEFGDYGLGPAQMFHPTSIAIGPEDNIYLSDIYLNRIQSFKKSNYTEGVTKAIIATGRTSADDHRNSLFEAASISAYWTLLNKGIDKNWIKFLTSNKSFDIDSNGKNDDIDGQLTFKKLEAAILNWTLEEPKADSLILYLVDHGETDTFYMNSEGDILTADTLKKWLNKIQNSTERDDYINQVIVIYDACKSGSFIDELKEIPENKERVIITSSAVNEDARFFAGYGSMSFSKLFWTAILNGNSIGDAFFRASNQMLSYQNAQFYLNLKDNNDFYNMDIGNDYSTPGETPIIESEILVTTSDVDGETQVQIKIEGVHDDVAIKQVIATVELQGNTVIGEESNVNNKIFQIELIQTETGAYENSYTTNTKDGMYKATVFAEDIDGNISVPKLSYVEIGSNKSRKAVLIAGYAENSELKNAIYNEIENTIAVLKHQDYNVDNIYLLISGETNIDLEEDHIQEPCLENLDYMLTSTVVENAKDVLIYMIGKGGEKAFQVNKKIHCIDQDIQEAESHPIEFEYLTSIQLKEYIDHIESKIEGTVFFIYDACKSGSFIPDLTSPYNSKRRILITSTNNVESANFTSNGIYYFSHVFWSNILCGQKIYDAFVSASLRVQNLAYNSGGNQIPCIDTNGDGKCNDESESINIAKNYLGGKGITLASVEPEIINVSPIQTIESSSFILTACVRSSNALEIVWAVIIPQDTDNMPDNIVDACEMNFPTVSLTYSKNSRQYSVNENCRQYSVTYNDLEEGGTYKILFYAMDKKGYISEPAYTSIVKPDIYESDNIPHQARAIFLNKKQHHNFYKPGDIDWLYFLALADESYDISAYNVGSQCDIKISIYKQNKYDEPIIFSQKYLTFDNKIEGIYYIKLENKIKDVGGINTEYDIIVNTTNAPSPLEALIYGTIRDNNNMPIPQVEVSAQSSYCPSDEDGTYKLDINEGNIDIFVKKLGYQSARYTVLNVVGEYEYNIEMIPNDNISLQKLELNIPDTIIEGSIAKGCVAIRKKQQSSTAVDIKISDFRRLKINNKTIFVSANELTACFNIIAEDTNLFETEPVYITANANNYISDSKPLSIEIIQKIPLRTGWNLFSFSVNKCYYLKGYKPTTVYMIDGIEYEEVDSIAFILKSIAGKYSYLWGFDIEGVKTYNLTPLSDMRYMAAGYGYWIKINEDAHEDIIYAEFIGKPVSGDTKILLSSKNWNLIGYLGNKVQWTKEGSAVLFPFESTMEYIGNDIGEAFRSIKNSLSYVMGFDGSSKSYNLTPLSNMKYVGPGYGYFIKINIDKDESIDFYWEYPEQ